MLTELKVSLRPSREEDMDFVLAAESHPDNRPYVGQWSRDQHLAWVNEGTGHYIVESDGRAVGYMMLTIKNRIAELMRLVITEKGRGFGRDALRAAKRLAFSQEGAHRLWLDVREQNRLAISLYESEGFVHEGTLRDAVYYQGEFVTIRVLSILETEYGDGGRP